MTISRLPTPEAEGVCYSEDETMKRRLIRKRNLEESEIYNAPETMAVKRRAVKEAAKTTPVPRKITNLAFDDQIEPSEAPDAPELERERKEAPLHERQTESHAAQDVVAVEPVGRRKVTGQNVDLDLDVSVNVNVNVNVVESAEVGEVAQQTQTETGKESGGMKGTKITLPKVVLDPWKWAHKSRQGARRSRRRLRRLLKEEQALLSSQLQVA